MISIDAPGLSHPMAVFGLGIEHPPRTDWGFPECEVHHQAVSAGGIDRLQQTRSNVLVQLVRSPLD